jgi:hypothetical protein
MDSLFKPIALNISVNGGNLKGLEGIPDPKLLLLVCGLCSLHAPSGVRMIKRVHQQVSVIAPYDAVTGLTNPRRMRWHGQVYVITRVSSRTPVRRGRRLYHPFNAYVGRSALTPRARYRDSGMDARGDGRWLESPTLPSSGGRATIAALLLTHRLELRSTALTFWMLIPTESRAASAPYPCSGGSPASGVWPKRRSSRWKRW